jgi:methionine salvage enolase-phosphatase E1
VFIDDVAANLDAAAELGIRTIQFVDRAQCEMELRRLGCL